ncbi:MAG: hypothetical protein ACLFST_09995 [Spirochaetia bacterium]
MSFNGNSSMVTGHFCKTPEDIEACLSLPVRKPAGDYAGPYVPGRGRYCLTQFKAMAEAAFDYRK